MAAPTLTDQVHSSDKLAPIMKGRQMLCPRCRVYHDVLWYERWGEVEDYAPQTNPIYRCSKKKGGCGWFFSPSDREVVRATHFDGRELPVLDLVEEVDNA
jgi:hypothetical protein